MPQPVNKLHIAVVQVRSVRAAVPDHDSIVCLDNGLYKVCAQHCVHHHNQTSMSLVKYAYPLHSHIGTIQPVLLLRCGLHESILAMRQIRSCWTMRWLQWGLASRQHWQPSLSSRR